MEWTDALALVVRQTDHTRFRELCAESWPDHAAYRALVIRLATGRPPADDQVEARELAAYVAQHGCGGC